MKPSAAEAILALQIKILQRLERIEAALSTERTTAMATLDDILAKVQAQTSIITSVRALVTELRAAQGDPAKMQAILDGLDANDAAFNAIVANTPEAPANPPAPPPPPAPATP